jgi:hypothetical protein
MDITKQHWITDHQLNRVEVVLEFGTRGTVALEAHGRSATKRGNLWTYRETFGSANSDLAPHDAAAHLLLVSLQDRPRSRELLDLALGGYGLWEDQPLPLT